MYKLSVPISMLTLSDETLPVYLEDIRKIKAERVFLCIIGSIIRGESGMLYSDPQRIAKAIKYFQDNGLETGIWVDSLGHGYQLTDTKEGADSSFTYIQGVNGGGNRNGLCPLDARFSDAYAEGIRALALLNPDIIMLDDDFRLNNRSYYMGCFCPLHLKEYYRRIGESVPVSQLEGLIFTGGPSKYRSEYMRLSAETLINFAKKLRAAVDSVRPDIRMGACTVLENWDYCGTDAIRIARAFAGGTRPFLRTIGAPYWTHNSAKPLAQVIEDTRLQAAWCKNADIEVFAEGDVYPRPRYNVPARLLECFDLALLADGGPDGILKYMFDYTQRPEYERGYIERHERNEALREAVASLFRGKRPLGVYAYHAMHKIERWQLPEAPVKNIALKMIDSYKSAAGLLLGANAIPVAYERNGLPALVFGENARCIDIDALSDGAILDVPAALILNARGVDTGLTDASDAAFEEEYFPREDDAIARLKGLCLKKIACKPNAEILSAFRPGNSPAAYTYKNAQGQRFYVLALDYYLSSGSADYFINYYRQNQLLNAIRVICDKKLPAVCKKNPYLYMIAAEDENRLAIALLNLFEDDIPAPVVQLNGSYASARFIGCEGKLLAETIALSDIAPFGFAAFELTKTT